MPRKDPRLSTIPKTVNEEAQDRAVRHLLRLLRLSNNEAAEIVDFMEKQVLPDLLDKISASLARMDLSGGRIKGVELQRLQRLAAGLDEILGTLGSKTGPNSLYSQLSTRMAQIAQTEAQWSASMLADVIPVKVETSVPSVNLLRSLVLQQPFDGAVLTEWFDQLGNKAKNEVLRQIKIGMVQGEGMDQLIARIRGTAAQNYTDGVLRKNLTRHAEALTRSAVIHSSHMAQMETFRQNDDLVKQVQWVATLDTRTCEQCMNLDGRTWDLGENPSAPVHIQCRCVVAPVLKSFREIGIDLDEAPPGTRASMNGQVPETKTYKTWLKGQSTKIQKEALGPTKYKLWKQGKVELGDFVNDKGQVLTLQQLRKKEGLDGGSDLPDWKSATSKKQAEQIFENLGMKNVNFNGYDLDTANQINEGAYWLANRLGVKVNNDLVFKKSTARRSIGYLESKYVGRRTPDGPRYYVEKTFRVSTNGEKVANVNQSVANSVRRNSESGFLSPNASIQSVSAHEMGHYYMTRIYDKAYGVQGLTRSQIKARADAWRAYEIPEQIIDDTLAAIGKNQDYMDDVYETLGRYSKANPHETCSMAIQYAYDNPGEFEFAEELINQMKSRL